jgi:hypothetical protein
MVLLFISDSQKISFRVDDCLYPVKGGYSPSELFECILFYAWSQYIAIPCVSFDLQLIPVTDWSISFCLPSPLIPDLTPTYPPLRLFSSYHHHSYYDTIPTLPPSRIPLYSKHGEFSHPPAQSAGFKTFAGRNCFELNFLGTIPTRTFVYSWHFVLVRLNLDN